MMDLIRWIRGRFNFMKNPLIGANVVSVLFFWWVFPLIKLGERVGISDIFDVLARDRSDALKTKLSEEWSKELIKCQDGGKKPSLMEVLWRTFRSEIIVASVLCFVKECIIKNSQPLIIGGMIQSFTNKSYWPLMLYGLGIAISSTVFCFLDQPYYFRAQHTAMRMRVALSSLVYQKSLRLSLKSDGQVSLGQVINYLSNDVNRLDTLMDRISYLWIAPIQLVIIMAILMYLIGPACLVGLALILIFLCSQGWLMKISSSWRAFAAKCTDDRVSKMREFLSAIRTIKMYAWEKPLAKTISNIRRNEMRMIRRYAYLVTSIICMGLFMSRVSLFAIIVVDFLLGNIWTAETMFVTIAFFNLLSAVVDDEFLTALQAVVEIRVSVKRLQSYLLLEEKSPTDDSELLAPQQCGIWLKDVNLTWPVVSEDQPKQNAVENLSLIVESGQMVAITGPVGAGKSTLVHHLIGELEAQCGSSKVSGRISYSPQEPWLFNGTIRQNILCGLAYDEERYERVIYACALKEDLENLTNGDDTPVGERGTSLSGGQRARISLARALYLDADIYILDDPLSALDARVGYHIFHQGLKELLQFKIRIVVTHQLHYLEYFDRIVVLEEGRILAAGTYEEVSDFISEDSSSAQSEIEDEEHSLPLDENDVQLPYRRGSKTRASIRNRRVPSSNRTQAMAKRDNDEDYDDTDASKSVSASVYWQYLRSGFGRITFVFFAVAALMRDTFGVGVDYWITNWIDAHNNNSTIDSRVIFFHDLDTRVFIGVYAGLSLGYFACTMMAVLMFFHACASASSRLHEQMLDSVASTFISFFDKNSTGSIMNRFSKDIGCVDEILPYSFWAVISVFLVTIFEVAFISTFISYWFLLPLIPILALFFYLRFVYLRVARVTRRLEAATKSSLYSHVCSSLLGLTTLRCHRSESFFQQLFDEKQDIHSSCWFSYVATSQWFALWLNLVGVVYITSVTFICIVARDTMTGSKVGLAISSVELVVHLFEWAFRHSATVENYMISAERVIEFSQLPPENVVSHQPASRNQIATQGEIRFENVSLRYDDSAILKSISCLIRPKEKIGIVGRSGAGKSSLIGTLFRLADYEGHVFFDGVDTKSIDLLYLRSKISIIPQEPLLFSGTLRSNLDPFGDQYNDEIIWKALEAVNLTESLSSLASGLDTIIPEGGSNFSLGQRQMICLARAVLRQNRIIVLDEATANLDPKLDAVIQDVIREQFNDCTILTIAHRVQTILDYDRIMVLDHGQIREFAEPSVLLGNPDSLFSKLVQSQRDQEKPLVAKVEKTEFVDDY